MIAWAKRYPAVIAFTLFAVAVFVSFGIQERATHDRKRQICTAEIEQRVVIRDIIDFAIPNTATPQALAFRKHVYERTRVPPAICQGTGINVDQLIQKLTKR